MKLVNKFKVDTLITSVGLIVLGILFILNPMASANALCVISGWILTIVGFSIIWSNSFYGFFFSGYSVIFGILIIVLGLSCIANPLYLAGIISFILGLLLIIDSMTSFIDSIECKKLNLNGWIMIMILSLITFILGVLILMNPTANALTLIGCALLVDGICDLVLVLRFSNIIHEARKSMLKSKAEFIDAEFTEKE